MSSIVSIKSSDIKVEDAEPAHTPTTLQLSDDSPFIKKTM